MVATMVGLAPVSGESVDPPARAALAGGDQPPLSPAAAAFERGPVAAFDRGSPQAPEVTVTCAGAGARGKGAQHGE